MVPVMEQFSSFFFTVAVGLVIGIIIDFYRSIIYYRRLRPWAIAAGDLLIWLFLTVLVFFLLLLNNWGEVRVYVLLGIATGFLLYRKWFSPFMFRFWCRAFSIIGRIGRLLLHLAVFPVKLIQRILFLPLGLLSMLLDWIGRFLAAVARKAGIRPRRWWESLRKCWRKKVK